ncbi:MAG: hypothetical protein KAS48_01210 [Gammaproteobacteria bacterium]|nr:hypothetical protein [Gammaproteobacteria bacterium]
MALLKFSSVESQLEDQVLETNCPIFKLLNSEILEETKYHILDIGIPNGANIQFFSRYYCRLTIEGGQEKLAAMRKEPDLEKDEIHQRIVTLFPYSKESHGHFDLILCWDVLNYLKPAVFNAFMQHISQFARCGTYLHAFISPKQTMSATPRDYQILDDGRMRYTPSGQTIPSPSYHQTDLRELMPQFTIKRSVLLKNGMQEYLFRR